MKLSIALLILSVLLLNACASKSVTTQDRNEILIDDLYQINKTLTQRISQLENQLNGIKNNISKTQVAPKTSFNVKGKRHEIDNSIYYGSKKNTASSKPLPAAPKPIINRKYSNLVKEMDKITLAKESQTKDSASKKRNNSEKQAAELKTHIETEEPTAASLETITETTAATKAETITETKVLKASPAIKVQVEPSYYVPKDQPSNINLLPVERFDASTFRTVDSVQLIDEMNEIQISWVAGTSFTAREKHGDYYKVSGYFVDKNWTPARQFLLLPIAKTIAR